MTQLRGNRERAERWPLYGTIFGLGPRKVPLVRKANLVKGAVYRMDFCRRIAELADAVSEKRPPRLSARWSLHVNELVLTMQYPEK